LKLQRENEIAENKNWLLWQGPWKDRKLMFRSFIYSHSGIERENGVKIRPGGQKHTEAKHYGDDESIPMDVSCTSYKSCNATGVLNFNYTYSLGEALQIIAFANRPSWTTILRSDRLSP